MRKGKEDQGKMLVCTPAKCLSPNLTLGIMEGVCFKHSALPQLFVSKTIIFEVWC